MSIHTHQRLLIAMAVTILVVFVAAAAVATPQPSSPIDKTGSDQFAQQAVVVGPTQVTPVVYVATGANFPDALGAAPAAGIQDAPILLVAKDSIPGATRAELQRLKPHEIAIVGGTAVISPAVAQALKAYAPDVYRLAGNNRYETAAKISHDNFPASHEFVVYDTSGTSTQLLASCVAFADLKVSVDAPGPGTIIVEANVNLAIQHSAGKHYIAVIYIGTSPTDCDSETSFGGDNIYSSMGPEPTGSYYPWYTMKKVIHVDTRGTTDLYVTGVVAPGTYPVTFFFAYMDARFIPDPGS